MTDVPPPAKLRRAQAERTETMRRRLLDAAVAVLKSRGLAGFRTAEVVMMAGVSKGALLHHFPTKVSLIAAAFEWLREGTDVSASHFRKRETLAEVIADLVAESRAFFTGESFSVSLDVAISAARTPELRDAIFDTVRGFRQRTEALWIERLASFGVSHEKAADAVMLVNAALRGSAVRSTWDADRSLLGRVERITADMVTDYLTRSAASAAATARG
ncbi:TetR/AcrR family transcriptional regulator [Sphingomonas sp. MG17]|uniref:TetR/AcrR family transcriptional regulator n=1 Tax=Sphingomonas tagetis TaxID=2949092 RepID=A0A9X2HJ73_9SPHN|nr:TetR/AcrR family transcriptional regulator [Sphingomonas tagetis]MCP3730612.1 TetR/AcrR family transcriptional regulator [Sphingomonas tagetis]